jgi:hypothetical protein
MHAETVLAGFAREQSRCGDASRFTAGEQVCGAVAFTVAATAAGHSMLMVLDTYCTER